METEDIKGKKVKLIAPIRLSNGNIYKGEAVIIKAQDNLGRHMYLVRLDDNSTSFVFPDEVEFINAEEENKESKED